MFLGYKPQSIQRKCFYLIVAFDKETSMLQQAIKDQIQKIKNFLGFARYYAQRNLTPQVLFAPMVANIKDALSIFKKRKMAKYRLDYQIYKLKRMESLIAENNSHYFLTGRKLNDIR